jgi:hypothetical protein
LEHDIENYQKDRDSVFYLDDDFYNKLRNMYAADDDAPEGRITEAEVRETVDDVNQEISKSSEPESSNPSGEGTSRSQESENEESGISESNPQNSVSDSEQKDMSVDGIGVSNKKSSVLNKSVTLKRAIPQ